MKTPTWPLAPCEFWKQWEWVISRQGLLLGCPRGSQVGTSEILLLPLCHDVVVVQVGSGHSLTPSTVSLPALQVAMAKFLELSKNISFPVWKVGLITVLIAHASDED